VIRDEEKTVIAPNEKDKYVLVAISGLEEGYETRLLLIPDPLKRLRWEPNTALVVSGLTKQSSSDAGEEPSDTQ
jgi:hypothetical protein